MSSLSSRAPVGRVSRRGLFREARTTATSQPAGSIITTLLVAAVCAVILTTTGQSSHAEQQVLSSITAAGSRSIVITDTDGTAGITPSAVNRIQGLNDTVWALGFSQAVDTTNAQLGTWATPVPEWTLYGTMPAAGITHASTPGPRQGLTGPTAATSLGLTSPYGAVSTDSGRQTTIVGSFTATGPLDFLNSGIILHGTSTSGHVAQIILLADTAAHTKTLAEAASSLLAASNPSAVHIQTPTELAKLNAVVAGQLGSFGRGLAALILITGLVLTGLNIYGQVTSRRRDFGRRRALGATRNTLIALIETQTLLVAVLGTLLGTTAGLLTVWRLTGGLPAIRFILGTDLLTILAACAAAIPPAIIAARRDPLHVLRQP